MSNVFFTSDTHFGHANIIKYCDRPFVSVDVMDEALINCWNFTVRPSDTVYHLGDFAFATEERILQILRRLNGQKHLVLGNHDQTIRKSREAQRMFNTVSEAKEIKVGNTGITLCHFPMLVWNKSHRGNWMLHGHCHGSLNYPFKARITDVGTDCWAYTPVSYDELQFLDDVEVHQVDHH